MLPLQEFNEEELKKIYAEYFSLGYLNTDIGSKFAVISLICYLTYKTRLKKPKTTCYEIITKVLKDELHTHDQKFLMGLAIVCEDFMKQTSKFLTFEIKTGKEMALKIKEILNTYCPF